MELATTRETASHTFGWLENQQISMLHTPTHYRKYQGSNNQGCR